MVNICPKCGKLLKNSKYCDSCDSNIEIKDEIQEYEEGSICMNFYKIRSMVKREDFALHKQTIENPRYIDESNNTIYFLNNESHQSLHKYVGNRRLEFTEINEIFLRLIAIFKELEEDNLIISAINLEDFWLKNEDVKTLKLWNRRKFIKEKIVPENFDYGYSITSPEVLNKMDEKLDQQSNVYLLGKLFLQLSLNNFGILNDDEEMYYGYNLLLFRKDLSYKFHNFIMKCLNITKEKRYKSIKELEKAYIFINKKNDDKDESILRIESLGSTHVGVNKLKKALKEKNIRRYDDENEFNEDMFLILKDEKEEINLLALGDGVSTASLGSGKEASTILRENIIKVFKEKSEFIKDEDSIKAFCKEIIKRSNIDIIESIKPAINLDEKIPLSIMASTLILAVIIRNKMYYTSIGDSRIFIYSEKDGLNLLNYEDNVMNLKLTKGIAWEKVANSQGRHAITRYIGGGTFKEGSLRPRKFDIEVQTMDLEDGQIIIICSDGVTDYINKAYFNDDLWKITESLEKIIKENKEKSLETLNKKIINEANLNGGGDNITIITSKVYK